jgi:hypothetical protein
LERSDGGKSAGSCSLVCFLTVPTGPLATLSPPFFALGSRGPISCVRVRSTHPARWWQEHRGCKLLQPACCQSDDRAVPLWCNAGPSLHLCSRRSLILFARTPLPCQSSLPSLSLFRLGICMLSHLRAFSFMRTMPKLSCSNIPSKESAIYLH